MIVVVLLALLVILAPFMAKQVTGDTPLFNASTNQHAALAAAEAGVQWYRDNLDSHSAYYNYTAANPPSPADPALSGYCGAGLASTCDLGGTNPAEAFHYVPVSNLTTTGGVEAGTLVLTVTGRAGVPGTYAYVYAQATFSPQSVLDDAYFSNYEVLDPSSLTVEGINVSLETPPGGTPNLNPEAPDLCHLHPYQRRYCRHRERVAGGLSVRHLQSEHLRRLAGADDQRHQIFSEHPYYGPYQEILPARQSDPSFIFEINKGGGLVPRQLDSRNGGDSAGTALRGAL